MVLRCLNCFDKENVSEPFLRIAMQMIKKIKGVSFLLVFALINTFLTFALEPVDGASELMWSEYYEQEDIDTVFIGSSVCQGTFDPYIFEERLGVKPFNMGTPSQAMPQTIGALETALKDHDIKTVIFGMGFTTLKLDAVEEAELTFENMKARNKGGAKGVLEALSYIYSDEVRAEEKSVNYLFPWLYNREEISLGEMKENITVKLGRIKAQLEGAPIENQTITYKGFRNEDETVFNYDNRWQVNTYCYYEPEFDEAMMQKFEELLALCQKEQITLIVLNTPHPYFDVLTCYETYEKDQETIVKLCEQYGAEYYDFNLAKPEIFETHWTYFSDYEHMNKEGARVFCESLCDFLIRREAGEDMEPYFYTVEEFFEKYSDWLNDWKNIMIRM